MQSERGCVGSAPFFGHELSGATFFNCFAPLQFILDVSSFILVALFRFEDEMAFWRVDNVNQRRVSGVKMALYPTL